MGASGGLNAHRADMCNVDKILLINAEWSQQKQEIQFIRSVLGGMPKEQGVIGQHSDS